MLNGMSMERKARIFLKLRRRNRIKKRTKTTHKRYNHYRFSEDTNRTRTFPQDEVFRDYSVAFEFEFLHCANIAMADPFPLDLINKLTSVFYASVLLLIMNFVITLSK